MWSCELHFEANRRRADIKILNRGPSFKINGEERNAEIAKDIILRIYDDLDEKQIRPEEVHLYLRKGMNDLKNINKETTAVRLLRLLVLS